MDSEMRERDRDRDRDRDKGFARGGIVRTVPLGCVEEETDRDRQRQPLTDRDSQTDRERERERVQKDSKGIRADADDARSAICWIRPMMAPDADDASCASGSNCCLRTESLQLLLVQR